MEEAINKFMNHVENLYELGSDGHDGFSAEFQKIKAFSASIKKQPSYLSSSGEHEENKKKNRYKDILPFDKTRVKLSGANGGMSDYINASFIKGAGASGPYIASQGPLPHTVGDFWQMLWQRNVKLVVMVCREVELGKPKCERYWAEENETKHFDDISVTLESQQSTKSGFCHRNILVQKGKEKRKLVQLHYTAWPDHGVPRTREEILTMISTARQVQGYQKDLENPVCVHCSAGCGRTGAVLVIDYFRNLLTRKNLTNQITAFEVVKEMRKQRPAIVQTKDQYEFVYLAISEMFTKHLKLLNGQEPISKFSKSLLSTNYENVILPGATTTQLKQSNSNEMSRQSYENVSLVDSSEKPRFGSSVGHTIESSPPPKPGRRVVDRKPGALDQSRPVSTIEPTTHKQLSPPVASTRKSSMPNNPDFKQQVPPPKPSLQKKPSDSKQHKIVGISPKKIVTSDNTSSVASNVQSISKTRPSPRHGKPSEIHGVQGKTNNHMSHLQTNSCVPDLASNLSVQKHIKQVHGRVQVLNPPPVKPKPRSNAENKIVVAESVQKRKERLWSTITADEQSSLKKTSPTVTASAIDLRMIDEPTFKNPRKSFTRTFSVDKGNLAKPFVSSSGFLSVGNSKNQMWNLNNNSSSSTENTTQNSADSQLTEKPKPPVLPKKSFRRKPQQQNELSQYDDKQKRRHSPSDDFKQPLASEKVGYVNITGTQPLSTSGYEDVDIDSKATCVSIYTPLNVQKTLTSKDSTYDMLKRSFKAPTKKDNFQHFKEQPKSWNEKYSESNVENSTKKLQNSLVFDCPRPFNRSPLSSTASSVFDASPTSKESITETQITSHDLHDPCFDIDLKAQKPSPPIKPQRASKKPKIPAVQPTNKPESQTYSNQEIMPSSQQLSDGSSRNNSFSNKPNSPYYSIPAESMSDPRESVKDDHYAAVDNAVVSTKKSPPNLPGRTQFSEAPQLPTRTADSYIFNEDENSFEEKSSSYEPISELRPSHNETGRRTSGASSHAGFRAKAKGVLGRTTNVLKVTAHNFTGTRTNEDCIYDPSSRTPTFKQAPVIYGNQDISYGQRYPHKPKGARPAPSKWTSN